MTPLASLWLPILLSAVFIFIASTLLHTVIPWHHGDFVKLPDESGFRSAVGSMNIPPGDYMIPGPPANMAEVKSPEYAEKRSQGPVMLITAMERGIQSMTPMFVQWMIYLLIVSTAAACIASRIFPPGTPHENIWHYTGYPAFLAYSMALPQAAIWYHRKWSSTIKSMIDGAIYAVITALTFGWLWPQV